MKLPFLRSKKRRVAIIGLDCAEPSLVFDQFAAELPTLTALRQRGIYGELESVIPAITVPAWSCMTSGRDPGALGIYGFRNRRDYAYGAFVTANSTAVHQPRLWDILTTHGKESIVLGVPGTYPPTPIKGAMVGCFLTPPDAQDYTYPPELFGDLARWVGDYRTDIKDFRTENKAWLLEQIYEMTRRRFEVARKLLETRREWDLFMMVEMGVDRIHHAFWKDMDAAHPKHDPASPFKNAIREYYRYIDGEVQTLLERFDDHTHVLVVSDHGGKRMDGGVCINEWLIREGYLALHEAPQKAGARLETPNIDWSRTTAWGEGGYYGRVFLNVQGREPQGVIPLERYQAVRAELAARLEALGDQHGQPIGTRCFTPEQLYPVARGVPPDLLVYFGDLRWRSIGTLGWNSIHVFENDTGPDDANHAQQGMMIYHDPQHPGQGERISGAHLMQIAPTVLRMLGVPVPADMQREAIQAITG